MLSKSLIVGVVLLMVLLIILIPHKTMKIIAHGPPIGRFFNPYPRLKEGDKNPNEWKYLDHDDKILCYLHLSGKNMDMKSVSGKNMGMKCASGITHLVICHGAGWSLEYRYDEYKSIVDKYNVDIISLEYPGFGARSRLNDDQVTKQTLIEEYPQEVKFLIEQLRVPWKNVAIMGECFGTWPALKIAAHPQISPHLNSLYLSKPFLSLHLILKMTRVFYPLAPLFNTFNCSDEPEVANIFCNLYYVQGANDSLCTVDKSKRFVEKFVNSKSSTFIVVPDVDHSLSIANFLDTIAFTCG